MKKITLLCWILVFSLGSRGVAQDTSSRGWEGAFWVWDQPDANQVGQNNEPRYLRRTFDLAGKALKAELSITADNHYVVHVNGQKIGADGEWNTVEKYDVTKYLGIGKNILAIQARNQGGVAGVIARLHVQTENRKDLLIATDAKTRINLIAGPDWTKTDYDDTIWTNAVPLGDASIGPWHLTGNSAGNSAGQITGKGPKAYGSAAVDGKVKDRLRAAEQIKHFIVPKDFEIELIAADPLVINPITITLDDKGRIIASESHTYRYGPPGSPIKPYANPVVRLDPDGKGGFQRTLVADGFEDPVMGIAVKGDKLWLTANNYLYTYNMADSTQAAALGGGLGKGIAINKKVILTDKNKTWNPFGMYVLEWGPEGKLYMSVGNHGINIQGPDGSISGRGGSGIIMRMNPDGTKMERLVHGLRVPYSYDFDPFGQLWLLSNGEGNPDRFVRVIDQVDYHCFTRSSVDNNWLAGNHPLAPPCEEVHGGAHTQFMRYFAAAYPQEYQGNLFACNWGRHGFGGPNRGIFRFVLDERNNIVKKDTLVACTDPHFRPSHIILDPDGNLLIADWYGRDDESDMTGRIWRLKYVGKEKTLIQPKLGSADGDLPQVLSGLGSPDHRVREKAIRQILHRQAIQGSNPVQALGTHAAKAPEPMGAASALWTLLRMETPESSAAIAEGTKHPDWKVRRLALNLMRRYQIPGTAEVAKILTQDADSAVRVEAALALEKPEEIRAALVDALRHGASQDVHLRYEAAWHLGKHADQATLLHLLAAEDETVRLAGLIAIDVACHEGFENKKAALAALGKLLENPGPVDLSLVLTLAQLNADVSVVPSLEKIVARTDLPPGIAAKAIMVLKTKAGALSKDLAAAAGKRLIDALEKGAVRITTPAEHLIIFEFLEAEGPTPFALKQIASQIRSGQPAVRTAAHLLARKFGSKSALLANQLWPGILESRSKFEDAVEELSTIVRIETQVKKESWEKLLTNPDPLVRLEAVRWWRNFKGVPDLAEILERKAPELMKSDDGIKDDLSSVFRHLETKPERIKAFDLPPPETDKTILTKYTLAAIAALPGPERQKHAALGKQVFERAACTKCHTTATQTTLLAPSLKGIAGQKIDYLIESVLYPSKIIKTGFESETVVTADGKVQNGLVKDDGKFLRVLSLDKDILIPKGEVESRSVQKISIMPEGQEAQLSRREFVDLITYMMTLR